MTDLDTLFADAAESAAGCGPRRSVGCDATSPTETTANGQPRLTSYPSYYTCARILLLWEMGRGQPCQPWFGTWMRAEQSPPLSTGILSRLTIRTYLSPFPTALISFAASEIPGTCSLDSCSVRECPALSVL